jgi:hypothetical protein
LIDWFILEEAFGETTFNYGLVSKMLKTASQLNIIEDEELEAITGGMWSRFKAIAGNSTETGIATPQHRPKPPSPGDLAKFNEVASSMSNPFQRPPMEMPRYNPPPKQPEMKTWTPPPPPRWPGVRFAR